MANMKLNTILKIGHKGLAGIDSQQTFDLAYRRNQRFKSMAYNANAMHNKQLYKII
jgi:hypothetical protein